MNRRLSTNEIEQGVRSMITAETSSLGVEICTPVIYPNGDPVVVVVSADSDGAEYRVHDAGLGSYFLAREGISLAREATQRIGNIAARYKCIFQNDSIEVACVADDVPSSIMLVANASRAVADHALEARRQSDDQFRYALSECVREVAGKRARYNEVFKGASGRGYRVPNVILDVFESKPIAFVVPLASRSSVSNQFRELYDLRSAISDVENESVYKENSDFRPDEDGWVLRQVGNLLPFQMARRELALLAGTNV